MPSEYEIREMCERIWRVMRWKGRIGMHLRPHYCDACELVEICNRLKANELIMRQLLRGEDCPDFKSILERIL